MPKRKKVKKQPRQTRRAKSSKNQWIGFFISLAPYIISFTVVGCLIGGSCAYAIQSNLFALERIQIKPTHLSETIKPFDLLGLRQGQSLLSIDLHVIKKQIERRYPEYQEAIVRRVLPSDIHIRMIERAPVAKISVDKTYWIDREGVILPPLVEEEDASLIQISGISGIKRPIRIGSRIKHPVLETSLQLVFDVTNHPSLGQHEFVEIDLSDLRNFILRMKNGIDIRLGSRNLAEKLKKLNEALLTLDINPEKIRYIDLRFDDIIVGPR